MIEPDPLPSDLEAEVIAAGDRVVTARRAQGLPIESVHILEFIRREEPDLYARFLLAISPETRRRVALVRQAIKDAPESYGILYDVFGPDAFGAMLREVDQQIADNAGDEFEVTLLKLRALDMRKTLSTKILEQGRLQRGESP